MVKLTPELVQQSMQYINPCRDRELDLRGYKIPQIENMGATLDQFDTIDMSDNDIRKLDGFPLLKRLKCILLNHNRIVRIGENLEQYIPNIDSLIMTGNSIQELGDLDPLATLPNLRTLSLMQNPVADKPNYRAYMAHKFPELKLLDFRKIKEKERLEANQLFKSKKGKELLKEISKKSKTTISAGTIPDPKTTSMTAQELERVREAIRSASTLQEVERLARLLHAGQLPGQRAPPAGQEDQEEEEMEVGPTNGH